MDAPSTEALEDELAELRRRAYGPDADIAGDASAAARLRELERLLGPRSAPPLPPTVPAVSAAPAEPVVPAPAAVSDLEPVPRSRASDRATNPAPEEPRTPPAGDTRPDAASRPRWWRRSLWVGVIAGLVGLAVGIGVPALTAPHPSRTLTVVGGPPSEAFSDDAVRQTLDYLGVTASSMRRVQTYGDIQPWIATGSQGSSCLLLSSVAAGLTGGFYGVSCTPPGADWVVDVRLDEKTRTTVPDRSLRTGSLLRFEGHGGDVQLWIVPAPAAST